MAEPRYTEAEMAKFRAEYPEFDDVPDEPVSKTMLFVGWLFGYRLQRALIPTLDRIERVRRAPPDWAKGTK